VCGPRRDQRGETLIESLLSILILAMIAMAAYSGYTLVIRQTSDHKSSASAGALLRSAAEQLQSPDFAYVPRAGCAGGSTYAAPAPKVTAAGWTVKVTTVQFWTGASTTPSSNPTVAFSSTCPATAGDDLGLQQLELTVTGPHGYADSTTIMKRRP
jgi:prepilin-type N-terminal cleavage/methylation domain-containing protein